MRIEQVKREKNSLDIYFRSERRALVKVKVTYGGNGFTEQEQTGEVDRGLYYFQMPLGNTERIRLFTKKNGIWELADERKEGEETVRPKTTIITPEKITLESLTADPVLTAGDIWFRSDLGSIKLAVDPATGDIRKLFSDRENLIPSVDNSYDLGSSSYRWRNAYLYNRLYITRPGTGDQFMIDLQATEGFPWIRLISYSDTDWGGSLAFESPTKRRRLLYHFGDDEWRFYADAIGDRYHFGVNGPFRPGTDNLFDLGTSSYRWRNLLLAGYANIGSLQIGGTEVINSARRLVGLDRVDQRLDFNAPCEYIRAQPSTAPLPLALYIYYNRNYLAFAEPDVIEYYNGTAWVAWTSPPDFKKLTDGIPTEISIDDVHKQFRLTYKAGVKGVPDALSVSGCVAVIVSFGWGVERTATITVESSGDEGVTWTSRGSYSVSNILDRWVYFPITEIYPDTWIRFTFNIDLAAGESNPIHHLLLLSGRANDQGLAALDSGFPFTWETDKRLVLEGAVKFTGASGYNRVIVWENPTDPYLALDLWNYRGIEAKDTYNIVIGTYGPTAVTRLDRLRITGNVDIGLVDVVNAGFGIGGTEVLTSGRVLQNIASVNQTLLPTSDSAYDLGSSSYRWRDIFLSRDIFLGDRLRIPSSGVIYAAEGSGLWGRDDVIRPTMLPLENHVLHRPVSDVEYWDGTAWVSWTPAEDINNLVDGDRTSYIYVDYTHRKFRFTVDIGRTYTYHSWIILGLEHPTRNVKVTIENSDDKVTWYTGIPELTVPLSYWGYIRDYIGDRRYWRFTIDFYELTAGETQRFTGIEVYGMRYYQNIASVNSLKIRGTEVINSARQLVGLDSVNQSLLPTSDNIYDLGSSSYRWREGVFNLLSAVGPAPTYVRFRRSAGGIYGRCVIDNWDNVELTNNAWFDGTNWNRDDTASSALLLIEWRGRGFVFDYTDAGANPITWREVFDLRVDLGQSRLDLHLLPKADNSYDLGSTSYRWRDLRLSRDVYSRLLKTISVEFDRIEVGDDNIFSRWLIEQGIEANCLRFFPGTITVEYYDFATATWTSWTVDASVLFDGYSLTYLTADYDHRRFRITLDWGFGPDATAVNQIRIRRELHWAKTGTLTVEYSTDGTTWSSAGSFTLGTAANTHIYRLTTTLGIYRYIRFTFDLDLAAGETMIFRDIEALTTDWDYFKPLVRPYFDKTVGFWNKIQPETDNAYDLGSSSYRWRYAHLRYGLRAYTQGYSPRTDAGDTYKIYQGAGPTSDLIHTLQDGTGRVQWYWNSTPGTSPTFIIGGEHAGKILFNPPLDPWFRLFWASGTGKLAGDPITWTELLSLTQGGQLQLPITGSGAGLLIGGDTQLYRDAIDVLKTPDNFDALALRIGGTEVLTSGRVLQNIASVNQTLLPTSDNAYDLGNSTYFWRNAFIKGRVYIGGTDYYLSTWWVPGICTTRRFTILNPPADEDGFRVAGPRGSTRSLFSNIWRGNYLFSGEHLRGDSPSGGVLYVKFFDGTTFTTYTERSQTYGYGFSFQADTDDYIYVGYPSTFTYYWVYLTTLGAGYTLEWEYWNGSAWTALTVTDPTSNLTTNAEEWTSWSAPADWATTTVDGITAYWIRFRTSTAPTTVAYGYISYGLFSGDFFIFFQTWEKGRLTNNGNLLVAGYIAPGPNEAGGTPQASRYIIDGKDSLRINTHWFPASDNACDLGSSSYRWSYLYLSNTLRVTTDHQWPVVIEKSTGENIFSIDQIYPIVYIGQEVTCNLGVRGYIRPLVDNTYDLGTSAYFWKDIYQKGKHYFDPDSYVYYDTAVSKLKFVVDGVTILEMSA